MVIEVTTEERIIDVTVASYADLYASVIAAEVAAGESLASATEAAASAVAAALSETNAAASESASAVSESNAADSETAAGVSAAEAAASAATISPALFLAKADNLSGLADTNTSLANLGLPSVARAFIVKSTVLGQQISLELVPGTDVLAYDANLQSFVDAFTLPSIDGSSGQALVTDGVGNLSWGSAGGHGIWTPEPTLTGGLLWSQDIDGSTGVITTPDFDSGYDYRLILVDLGHGGGSETIEIEFYRDTSADWLAADLVTTSDTVEAAGSVTIYNPSSSLAMHNYESTVSTVAAANSVNNPINGGAGCINSSTAQPITKMRLDVGAYNFNNGAVYLFRTVSILQS